MVVSSGRQGHRERCGDNLRTQAESLSPPPPRSIRENDVEVPRNRWPHRQLPAPIGDEVVSAAEAVASALNMSPDIRLRMSLNSALSVESGSDHPVILGTALDAMAVAGLELESLDASSVEQVSEERWGCHTFADLETIAESPNEVVPERTPELRRIGNPFDTPGCEILAIKERFPPPSMGSASTQVELQSPCFSSSSSPSTRSTRVPSSRARSGRRPQPGIQSPPVVGSPVCFYIDGCVDKYVGWLKAISSNGLHTIDLVGGGRMVGLDKVSPCTEDDVKKADQQRRPVKISDDPYSVYRTPNRKRAGSIGLISSVSDPESSTSRQFAPGDAFSFSLEKHELSHVMTIAYPERFFGRVQKQHSDGSYMIELAGGVRRSVRQLSPCKDRDIEKAACSKKGLVTRKDNFVEENTRNAPAWGGGCGFSSGYRETSPHPKSGGLKRSVSTPVLPPNAATANRRIGKRSLSPPPLHRKEPGRSDLGEGSPVSFWLEGCVDPVFGRIRAVQADGTFTVECVGGRRVAGMRDLTACTHADVERAAKLKQPTITRKDMWADLVSRNRPSSRSPSPTPCLRGIAINSPPRSATRLSAP